MHLVKIRSMILLLTAFLSLPVSSCYKSLFSQDNQSEEEQTDSISASSDDNSEHQHNTDNDELPSDMPSSSDSIENDSPDDNTDSIKLELLGPPMVYAPTETSFRVNAVLKVGDTLNLKLFYRPDDVNREWLKTDSSSSDEDVVNWSINGLAPGNTYRYIITDKKLPGAGADLFEGIAKTAPTSMDDSFSFALISDAHIPAMNLPDNSMDFSSATLRQVGKDLSVDPPDFIVHLGDQIDFHHLGFNVPAPSVEYTKEGYLNYRRLLGNVISKSANFNVIGNWNGENGSFTEEQIFRSSSQRQKYMPGPKSNTYSEGGSVNEDYYAFTWGNALFIVLNIMTYTPTRHELGVFPGVPDDWTLGKEQFAWFEKTLSEAYSKWRIVFIHHVAGGNAGDFNNAAYGRGGGRAAYVGEQARIHELMRRHEVKILFYGHDHVFTDMVVDGIHYTLPGSAGAPWKFDSSITSYPEGTYYQDSGHGRVEVFSNRILVSFLGLGNTELHRFTVYP